MDKQVKSILNNRLKAPKKFFGWCESLIPTYEWSNKQETITSNRKNCEVIKRQLRSNSCLTFENKPKLCVICLVTNKRIEIQSYVVRSGYVNGKEYLDTELINLERMQGGKSESIGKMWLGWGKGLTRLSGGIGVYTNANIYNNGWLDKIQQVSELKYLDLYRTPELTEWRHIYKYKEQIEFLQKINCSLAKDIMFPKYLDAVDMRIVNKNWLRKNKQYLKNKTISFSHIELEFRLKELGAKKVAGIEDYMHYTDLKNIPRELKLVRFQNWLIKNKKQFRYYKDYLDMLEDLGITSRYERVLMPKNLQQAHDELVERINARNKAQDLERKREINEKFKKRAKQLCKLEKRIDDYVFLVPKSETDLQQEGEQLHHCVATYSKKFANGETTIVMIRKAEQPEKPLYTLEVDLKKKRKKQFYGKYNQKPEEQAQELVERYLQQI